MKTYFTHVKETAQDIFVDAPMYLAGCFEDYRAGDISIGTIIIGCCLIALSWILSPMLVPIWSALNYIRQEQS